MMKVMYGLFININNYGFYQDNKIDESNDEGNGEKVMKLL